MGIDIEMHWFVFRLFVTDLHSQLNLTQYHPCVISGMFRVELPSGIILMRTETWMREHYMVPVLYLWDTSGVSLLRI